MSWDYQNVMVGASGGSAYGIKPGAGVSGLISIGKSKGMKGDLSPLGRTAVEASAFALDELAGGNTAVAVGTIATSILAATSYYVGQAVDTAGTLAAASTAAQAAASVSSAIPLLQAVIGQVAQISAFVDARAGVALEYIQDKTSKAYFQTVSGQTGTGPYRQVVPADIFMGPTQNKDGDSRGDVFDLSKQWDLDKVLDNNRSQLAQLLVELEEPASYPTDPIQKLAATKAFPTAEFGLSSELRKTLANLRKGMSSMYRNNLTGNAWTPDAITDGGAALWVPYIDLLNSQWRKGRINYNYLVWRMLRPGKSSFATSHAFASLVAAGAKDPTSATIDWLAPYKMEPTNKINTANPWLFAFQGAIKKFQLMVDGWELHIKPGYTDNFDPSQAGDNPLHGPIPGGVVVAPRNPRSNVGLWVAGALALGASYYFKKPAMFASVVNSTTAKIRRSF